MQQPRLEGQAFDTLGTLHCTGFTNNVHLKVVSDRLNHSTTDITARVYSHVTRPIAQEAANLVGRLILKGKVNQSGPDIG